MTTTETDIIREHSDRISRLEGTYEHLATKADLNKAIGDLETRLVKWIVATVLAGAALTVGILRLTGG